MRSLTDSMIGGRRKFDEAKNLRDWWQPNDTKQFNASAARIIRQFNEFVSC